MNFSEFAGRCAANGLTAKLCHETHWQIYNGLNAVMDVWPTSSKYRRVHATYGEKASFGSPEDAIQFATPLRPLLPSVKQPEPPDLEPVPLPVSAPTREDWLLDEFAGKAMQGIISRHVNGCPTPEACAALAYDFAVAMLVKRASLPATRLSNQERAPW